TALSAPLADGWADFQEWDAAARYDAAEGGTLRALYVAVDNQQLTLRVDFSQQARQLVGKPLELLIYLDHPTKEPVNDGTRYGAAREDGIILGFGPAYEVRLDLAGAPRSEEHTSELQSRENLVCRLLLEKKKKRP